MMPAGKGDYTDFYDFLSKVDAVVCNKKTIESLIKAGAFDSMQHPRKGLLAVHADAIDAYADVKRKEAVGQYDLFGAGFGDGETGGGTTVMPIITEGEWEKRDKLAFERDARLYVRPPLFGVEHVLGAAGRNIARSPRRHRRRGGGPRADLRGAAPGHQQGRAGLGHREAWPAGWRRCFPPHLQVIGIHPEPRSCSGRVDRRETRRDRGMTCRCRTSRAGQQAVR